MVTWHSAAILMDLTIPQVGFPHLHPIMGATIILPADQSHYTKTKRVMKTRPLERQRFTKTFRGGITQQSERMHFTATLLAIKTPLVERRRFPKTL